MVLYHLTIFRFLFLVTFGNKVTKILHNLCLNFARQDGQNGKKWKENHATKVTKIPKTKRRNYGKLKSKMCRELQNYFFMFI